MIYCGVQPPEQYSRVEYDFAKGLYYSRTEYTVHRRIQFSEISNSTVFPSGMIIICTLGIRNLSERCHICVTKEFIRILYYPKVCKEREKRLCTINYTYNT